MFMDLLFLRGTTKMSQRLSAVRRTLDNRRLTKQKPWVVTSQGKLFDAQLTDLRAFVLTVDRGSVTAAAKALGETKGGVSRRLVRLEQAVSANLLQRGPRFVRPTAEGLVFRERVEASLALLSDAVEEASTSGEPSGTVRVTAPADYAVLLAPHLAEFGRQHPKIAIDMVISSQRLDLESEEIDVAFRIGPELADSSLIARRIQQMDLGFFAAPAYLRARRPLSSPQDLASHRTLIFRVPDASVIMLARRDGIGSLSRVRLTPSVTASDAQLLCDVAIAGGGIALVPTLFADEAISAGRLVPVLEDYVPPLKIIVHMVAKHRAMPRRVRLFLDFVAAAIREAAPRRRAPAALPGAEKTRRRSRKAASAR
jgi:DNA-binding transcriptional LysR family regulator